MTVGQVTYKGKVYQDRKFYKCCYTYAPTPCRIRKYISYSIFAVFGPAPVTDPSIEGVVTRTQTFNPDIQEKVSDITEYDLSLDHKKEDGGIYLGYLKYKISQNASGEIQLLDVAGEYKITYRNNHLEMKTYKPLVTLKAQENNAPQKVEHKWLLIPEQETDEEPHEQPLKSSPLY